MSGHYNMYLVAVIKCREQLPCDYDTGSVILSHSVRPIFAGGSLLGMLANALRFQATAFVNKDTPAL